MSTSPARPVALSPSRADDFMTCPLRYRFRVIDRLPEAPSPAATRGTVVHAVLERLYDLPAGRRTPGEAVALLRPEWERLLAKRPELAGLFPPDGSATAPEEGPAQEEGPAPEGGGPAPDGGSADDPPASGSAALEKWLSEAERLLERYFTLEDPNRLQPAQREWFVETVLEDGLRLRGFIDRVDVAPTGEVRVVDYKTGKAPPPAFASSALFQMKFYALVLWRRNGVLPRRLQLVYLGGSGEVVSYDPEESDLLAVERKIRALWQAIGRAVRTGEWLPRRSKLCDWCDFRSRCPEFGGTPPPYPLPVELPLQADGQADGREAAAAQPSAGPAGAGPGGAA